MCGPVEQLSGWADLAETKQLQVKAFVQTGLFTRTAAAAISAASPPAGGLENMDTGDAADATPAPDIPAAASLDKRLRNIDFWSEVDWEALHDPIRTMSIVPKELRLEIAELRGALARLACDSASQQDEVHAWKAFVFLDRLLFCASRRRRGGARGQRGETVNRTLCRRVRLAWQGAWSALWQESEGSLMDPGAAASTAAQSLAADVRAIEGALCDGDFRVALKRVDGCAGLATDAVARRCLPTLFPAATVPARAPACVPAAGAEDVERFRKELAAAFRHAPLRRGPGPGGGRGEHWSWLPEFADAWGASEEILLRFALGRVPAEVSMALLSARVLALDRPGTGKVRPLALGVFLRRSVSKAVARTFQTRVAAALDPVEHSLGSGRGAELMHRTVLLDLDSRGDAVKLSLDISNAHNEFDRQEAIEEIATSVPSFLPWALPGLLLCPQHVHTGADGKQTLLIKSRGGDQGDAITSMVFPLVYRRVTRATAAAARTLDPAAREYSYQDDLELVCLPPAVQAARLAFTSAAAAVGLRSEPSKDTLSLGRALNPAALPPCMAGVVVEPRALVLKHGSPTQTPLPALPAASAAPGSLLAEGSPEVAALAKERQTFFKRLRTLRAAGLSSQVALSLAQLRTGGDCTFVARCCGIPEQDALRLDEAFQSEVVSFLGAGLEPSNVPTSRVFLPGRDGGLGFQSQKLTAPAAHAASWHACLPRVLRRLELPAASALEARSPLAALALPVANRTFREALGDETVSIGDAGVEATQHFLASASLAAATARVADSAAADAPCAAALRSCGGPGAAAWLRPPTLPGHRMLDSQFAIALRTRLYLPVSCSQGTCRHRRPDGSLCGASLDDRGLHARSCPIGGWLVRRHNAGCAVLAEWAERECDCTVFREQVLPTASPDHAEARMDIVAFSPRLSGPVYVDLTVVSALSVESIARGSALRDGAAADVASARKESRYPNCKVVGFAVEDHGRFGEDALAPWSVPLPRRSHASAQPLLATYIRASAGSSLQ